MHMGHGADKAEALRLEKATKGANKQLVVVGGDQKQHNITLKNHKMSLS